MNDDLNQATANEQITREGGAAQAPYSTSAEQFSPAPVSAPPLNDLKAFVIYHSIRYLKIFLVFILSCTLSYLVVTADAQITRAGYFFKNLFSKKEVAQIDKKNTIKTNGTTLTAVKEQVKKSTPSASSDPYSIVNLDNNSILIPKINVKAPVTWNSDTDSKTLLSNLQNGVVHFKDTATPGNNGNVFISGHSSYYLWDKGKYKTIFSLLGKLENGDEITVSYNNKAYIYVVTKKFVVNPTDTWVTKPTETPTLSLMTCTPLGTNLKRLIVQAKLK